MPKRTDLAGQKINKLLVLHKDETRSKKHTYWICQCDCGNVTSIATAELNRGQKYCNKCVPKGRPSHGLSHLPEFKVWSAMKQRCDNPKSDVYENYGGRGIKYCSRWKDFESFLADMGQRPSKNYTLERKDNNGGYEPGNCVWATRKEQARNFRKNVLLEFNGQKKCISEWAEIYGLRHDTIASRLEKGMSVECAIITPVKKPRTIKYEGKEITIAELERRLCFTSGTISHRLKAGYSEEEAVLKFSRKQLRLMNNQ